LDAADAAPVAADAAPVAHASSGVRTIAACADLGVGTEACEYTFVYDAARCLGARCSRLVIYFSGGQESCPDAASTTSYLGYYRDQGYVAVCARDFESSTASDEFPRHRESPRVDLLVKTITSDPDVRAAWSGDALLFSGVSHGASGPVVTMATSTDDDQPSWKGRAYTGACFYDGTYDAPGLLALDYTNECLELTSVVSYERVYSRYCAWPPSARGSLPRTWPAPDTCPSPDLALDTVNAASVPSLAIHDWKLVECGSALPLCSGPLTGQDALPAAPIKALCDGIASSAGYTCAFGSFPQTSHIACGTDPATIGVCHDWFEGELAARGL
jgi:hypothetical protein